VILQQVEHLAWMGAALVAVIMLVLWTIHLLIRNAAIVDVGWAGGLAVLAFFYAIAASGYPARKWAMAKEWKTYLPFRFLFLFEFQAVLVVVLSLPFLLACVNPAAPLARIEKIGAGIWLLAMIGEAVADEQLDRFKKNPANSGKTLRAGLWKYSRHPNYFFDWLVWVGYAVFALGSPWGWLGLISPALVLYFLLSVTGIPATEAQALRTRGNEYRDYQRTTSIFVPWFPKKELPS
jgi:steroid 5-alpha reductase family enzyme